MQNPYASLEQRAFWRTGVLDNHALQPKDIYRKKFAIEEHELIATAGSCFAQHIADHLRTAGYHVIDEEPAPVGLDKQIAKSFGFGLYSARYGNIYTVRQLLQLVKECNGLRSPADFVWTKDGRYYDALRPSVEPRGLANREGVIRHRRQHLDLVRRMLQRMNILVFTLGLTEAWVDTRDGTAYPLAPGTIAGSYDPSIYAFKNFTYDEIMSDFIELRELLKVYNSELKFILTVSPVPLTATAGHEHVLAATTYSKSVLRAVAGRLEMVFPDVDYFPSYEIISGIPSRSFFYESNLRSVSLAGVDVVMRAFFSQHGSLKGGTGVVEPSNRITPSTIFASNVNAAQRVVCEEELLEAFSA